jgi:thiol-disulfide isomerase/thioredoxin
MRLLFYVAVGLLACGSCITTNSSFSKVAPGMWRGVLQLDHYSVPVRDKDTVFVLHDAFKEGELPFNFEVKYTDPERFYVEIRNGSERIICDSIRYGRDKTRARDTINIYFPEYQSYLHVDVRGDVMQGEWIVTTKENYRIPFYAQAGRSHRFTPMQEKPAGDLTGEWAAVFGAETESPSKAIGEFQQKGNYLEGTFRTETGDYRFLEGTVQGRKFMLSCFDGSHAFLFSGSWRNDSLMGEFRSGKTHRELFTCWRDKDFQLGSADTLTTVRSGAASTLRFDFTTPEGKRLTFPGPAFDGKIKIFTIMGTWCPNCRDEQVFMSQYLKKHPDMAAQMAVTGFAFERNKTPEAANAHLLQYKKKLDLPFDLVYAGEANKEVAQKVFPALNKVMAFPTMIVVDKNNIVRHVHTGFDGPATSRYAAFEQQFDQWMQAMR